MSSTCLIYAGGTFGCHGNPLIPLAPQLFLPKLSDTLAAHGYSIHFYDNTCIKDSSALNPADFVHFYQCIIQAYQAGMQRLILITGTDTLSYLAAFLTMALKGLPVSVVITGSMLPLYVPSSMSLTIDNNSDAWGNLIQALDFVQQAHMGVFVSFAGSMYLGDSVQKMHSSDKKSFSGIAFNETTQIQSAAITPLAFDTSINCHIHSLYCLPNSADDLAKTLTALTQQPATALILIGYGAGNLPKSPKLADTLQHLTDLGFLVIMASQTPFGARSSIYAAGAWQYDVGVLPSGTMTLPAIYARALWLCLSLPISARRQAWLDALKEVDQ